MLGEQADAFEAERQLVAADHRNHADERPAENVEDDRDGEEGGRRPIQRQSAALDGVDRHIGPTGGGPRRHAHAKHSGNLGGLGCVALVHGSTDMNISSISELFLLERNVVERDVIVRRIVCAEPGRRPSRRRLLTLQLDQTKGVRGIPGKNNPLADICGQRAT
jgi:hypothetical protein